MAIALAGILASTGAHGQDAGVPAPIRAEAKAPVDTRLTDAEFFAALDLGRPGLAAVGTALAAGDIPAARAAVCAYYRSRDHRQHWWQSLFEMPEGRDRTNSLGAFESLRDRTGAFARDRWRPDGTFGWAEVPDRHFQRMYFFTALGRAYQITKDDAAARAWAGIVRDWIAQFPAGTAHPAWATMTTGIRLRSGWGDAFCLLAESEGFDDSSMFLFLKSFCEQARHLRTKHSETSNWLTFEMAGLFAAGVLFPEWREAADWREHAIATVAADLDAGWLPDGMSIELTPGYGQFFINYLRINDLAKQVGIMDQRLAGIEAAAERLYTPYVQLMTPDRATPAFNDNGPLDVPKFLKGAAERYLERADFRWAATAGEEGSAPPYTSVVFPYAGYMVMRSGWERDAHYLCFDAGPVGYRHAHQDKLGLVLWAHGRPVLYDSGRENYADTPHQRYAMDTFSHSTGLVDNRPQRRPWYQHPSPRRRPYQPLDDFRFAIDETGAWAAGVYAEAYGRPGSAGSDAYPYKEGSTFREGWGKPATHFRQVAFHAPDIFVVQDDFLPNGDAPHAYEVRWQLDSTAVVLAGQHAATTDPALPNLAVLPMLTEGLLVETASAQDEPDILGWKVLGTSHPATALRHLRQAVGQTTFLTLLLPLRQGESMPDLVSQPGRGNALQFMVGGRRLHILPAAQPDDRLQVTVEP